MTKMCAGLVMFCCYLTPRSWYFGAETCRSRTLHEWCHDLCFMYFN